MGICNHQEVQVSRGTWFPLNSQCSRQISPSSHSRLIWFLFPPKVPRGLHSRGALNIQTCFDNTATVAGARNCNDGDAESGLPLITRRRIKMTEGQTNFCPLWRANACNGIKIVKFHPLRHAFFPRSRRDCQLFRIDVQINYIYYRITYNYLLSV